MNKVFDKIIEKLEELDVKSITRYKNGNFGNFDGVEYYIKKRKAIEIVQQCGISDDVCEWKKDNMFEAVYRVCGGFSTTVYQKDFEYCPYCGKKIKIVGD